MPPDHFRQKISSTITIPAQTRGGGGAAMAQNMAMMVEALRKGESLCASYDGLRSRVETDGLQWLEVQSAGSTGTPKTIRRRPASWIASFDVTRQITAPARTHAVLGALGHSLTLYAVIEALHLGRDLAVLTGLSPRAQIEALRAGQVDVLYATPTQLRLLCETGAAPLGLRHLFSGGGKLDPITRGRLSKLCPAADIREFFGAGETSFITLSDATTPDGTVGRPYPGVELEIRDADGRATQGAGELWVRSPYLFESYVQGASDQTRWRGGFLSIGEMGQVDAQGHLTLLGRKDRMVNVADQTVFPEAVEAVIGSVPNVGKTSVVPIKDPLRGHVLVGFVEGREDKTLRENLLKTCRDQLGVHATPRRIVFVDQLPLLPAGKPDLITLTQMARRL